MTRFEVYGPYEVPLYNGANGRLICAAQGKEFFKKHPSHATRVGCYVFGIRAGRGITPIYVGRTRRSFEKECFTADKMHKYNQSLVDYRKGKPVLFLLVPPVRRGVPNHSAIVELEKFLIQTAVGVNCDLANVQGTKSSDWGISGVVRSNRGRPSRSAATFRSMLRL